MSTAQEHLALAREHRRAGRPQDAFVQAEEAQRLALAQGEAKTVIAALKTMGEAKRDGADLDTALALYMQAEDRARDEGDALLLAHTIRHVGDIHWDMGAVELAEPCYEEALALYRENEPTPGDLANALRPMAILKEASGDKAGAYDLWIEAGELYRAAGVDVGAEECARRAMALASAGAP